MNSRLILRQCAAVAAIVSAAAPSAFAEMRNAKIKEDIQVLREPKEGSEALGKFRAGTNLRVFVPARNGWYATYFKNPVKGTNYGWMPEAVIELSEGQPTAAAAPSSRARQEPKKKSKAGSAETTLGVFGGLGMVSAGVGMKPTFGANLNFPVSDNILIGGNVGWIKINAASDPISANSFLVMAEGLYYFDRVGTGMYAGLKFGPAITMVSGITEVAGIEYETSGSDMTIGFAPTLGYDFGGQGTRWYVEGDFYLVSNLSIFSGAVGVKFGL